MSDWISFDGSSGLELELKQGRETARGAGTEQEQDRQEGLVWNLEIED